MTETKNNPSEAYLTIAEFYKQMLKIERRLSRLEIIYSINLIMTVAALIKLLLLP
jgi:hypothetical protein